MMLVKDILKGLKHKTESSLSGVKARGVTDDSRKIKKGDLFIALKGYSLDGHEFIDSAIEKGAKVIVAERDFHAPPGVVKVLLADGRQALSVIAANFYKDPSGKMKVTGITGTNGKTTITYIIENILKCARKEAGVIGTINYRFKGKVVAAKNTTPGPLELESLLAEMFSLGVRSCIMEVSSHSLDQGRVDPVLFDAAVFTNITSDHLDYHKTSQNYFDAKAKIFDKLKKDGVAILNADDKKVVSLKRSIKKKVLTYGFARQADIRAERVRLSLHGSSFDLVTPHGDARITTKLIGKHNISNILASAAASFAQGIKLDVIKKGVESFTLVPGRLESVDAGQPFRVFVDFAHTEDALYNILSLLREVALDRKIITVFGCGGNRDKTKRPRMGKVACSLSDNVIITSDNPRFEEPADIINDIEAGVRGEFSNYHIMPDRSQAIEKALSLASQDSIVVIAGKGHEKYQIVKDSVIPFDDCEVARAMLQSLAPAEKR